MPIKKASWKHLRQTIKRTKHNSQFKVAAEVAVKLARKAMASGTDIEARVKAAIKALDKTAQKGIIKNNNAARGKSRLMSAWRKVKK